MPIIKYDSIMINYQLHDLIFSFLILIVFRVEGSQNNNEIQCQSIKTELCQFTELRFKVSNSSPNWFFVKIDHEICTFIYLCILSTFLLDISSYPNELKLWLTRMFKRKSMLRFSFDASISGFCRIPRGALTRVKYVQTRALLWERHQKRTGAITLPKNLEARGNEDCSREGSSSKQCTKKRLRQTLSCTQCSNHSIIGPIMGFF